jgi:hypothetical protein
MLYNTPLISMSNTIEEKDSLILCEEGSQADYTIKLEPIIQLDSRTTTLDIKEHLIALRMLHNLNHRLILNQHREPIGVE